MSQNAFGYERCKCLLHTKRIVYQGLESVHSDLAAVQFFSQYPEVGFSHVKTFDVVVRTVDEGTGNYAVLPIESSIADSAADSYDALAGREISVASEYLLPIRHTLLTCDDATLTDTRTVYSHPQGIKQCVSFFEEHPEIEAAAVSNTVIAAQPMQTMGESSTAVIISACAGQVYGLEVLVPIPNYHTENTARSLIVGRERLYLRDIKTMSPMTETRHEAGALHHVLGVLYA